MKHIVRDQIKLIDSLFSEEGFFFTMQMPPNSGIQLGAEVAETDDLSIQLLAKTAHLYVQVIQLFNWYNKDNTMYREEQKG